MDPLHQEKAAKKGKTEPQRDHCIIICISMIINSFERLIFIRILRKEIIQITIREAIFR